LRPLPSRLIGVWRALQAHLVAAIKRRAIARLHRTPAGEALLLRIYLWAEEGVELEGLADLHAMALPGWLAAELRRHLADESRHAALLRRRLRALGQTPAPGGARVDPLSRLKLARLRRIAERAAGRFQAGRAVPLLALAFRMEAMGVRVIERHVQVLRALAATAPEPPALPLLEEILADERRHVASCARALDRLVAPPEQPDLTRLLGKIDGVERAFGITGALAMLALAWRP
jgi:hypothetical protein